MNLFPSFIFLLLEPFSFFLIIPFYAQTTHVISDWDNNSHLLFFESSDGCCEMFGVGGSCIVEDVCNASTPNNNAIANDKPTSPTKGPAPSPTSKTNDYSDSPSNGLTLSPTNELTAPHSSTCESVRYHPHPLTQSGVCTNDPSYPR